MQRFSRRSFLLLALCGALAFVFRNVACAERYIPNCTFESGLRGAGVTKDLIIKKGSATIVLKVESAPIPLDSYLRAFDIPTFSLDCEDMVVKIRQWYSVSGATQDYPLLYRLDWTGQRAELVWWEYGRNQGSMGTESTIDPSGSVAAYVDAPVPDHYPYESPRIVIKWHDGQTMQKHTIVRPQSTDALGHGFYTFPANTTNVTDPYAHFFNWCRSRTTNNWILLFKDWTFRFAESGGMISDVATGGFDARTGLELTTGDIGLECPGIDPPPPTVTPSATATAIPSISPTRIVTPTPTAVITYIPWTPSPTVPPVPSIYPTPPNTPTPIPSPTSTYWTPTPTSPPLPTLSVTKTPSPTATPYPTGSYSPAATATATPIGTVDVTKSFACGVSRRPRTITVRRNYAQNVKTIVVSAADRYGKAQSLQPISFKEAKLDPLCTKLQVVVKQLGRKSVALSYSLNWARQTATAMGGRARPIAIP